MIYLTTGANGAGKTLNTLKHVREKQVAEGRSVYYHGFAMKAEKAAEFGWKPFDPRKWQDLPDGAILIVDECQNEFPVRPSSSAVPEYVRGLSEHRRRGFDLFMITQHPQNIDMFVRRLIGSPGWHRHLKRAFGSDMVSVLEWSAVNGNCEKNGAGNTARVTMVPYPKEVFQWYDSASLHTAKKSIPRQVYVLASLIFVIPVLGYFGYQSLMTNTKPKNLASASSSPVGQIAAIPPGQSAVVTAADYVSDYLPRLPGFPNSAPRYDETTKPTIAPYPAACVSSGSKRCECYTQQATRIQVSHDVCMQIVKNGFFVDWEQPQAMAAAPSRPAAVVPVAATGRSVLDTSPMPDAAHAGSVLASMRSKPPV